MVRSITLNVGPTSHNPTQSDHILTRSSGAKAPFAGRQPTTLGGMEGFKKALEVREYQNLLPHLSQILEDQGQYLITNRPGESGLAGVINEKLIPLQVI